MTGQHRLRGALCGLFGLSLGLAPACGLRTDPAGGGLICVDSSNSSNSDETGGTGGEARLGSCENPLPFVGVRDTRVNGVLGGCGDSEGWCGARGGEDVYLLRNPGYTDVTLDFDPRVTEFDPMVRVLQVPTGGETDCGEGVLVEDQLACVAITNPVPSRSFWATGGNDYYIMVDSRSGSSGDYAFDLKIGFQNVSLACLDDFQAESIALGRGGVWTWQDRLEEGQGSMGAGGACSAPGNEQLFPLRMIEGGVLFASGFSRNGGPAPVISLRSTADCSGANVLGCGFDEAIIGETSFAYESPGARNMVLVVDNRGVERNDYDITVWME